MACILNEREHFTKAHNPRHSPFSIRHSNNPAHTHTHTHVQCVWCSCIFELNQKHFVILFFLYFPGEWINVLFDVYFHVPYLQILHVFWITTCDFPFYFELTNPWDREMFDSLRPKGEKKNSDNNWSNILNIETQRKKIALCVVFTMHNSNGARGRARDRVNDVYFPLFRVDFIWSIEFKITSWYVFDLTDEKKREKTKEKFMRNALRFSLVHTLSGRYKRHIRCIIVDTW